MYGHVCETGGTREILPPRFVSCLLSAVHWATPSLSANLRYRACILYLSQQVVLKSSKGLCSPTKIDWDIHCSSTSRPSNPHWQNTTMCQEKTKTSKSETAWLVEDAPCKSVLISSIEKVLIFLRNLLEKSPQYRHFIREIAVSENGVLLVLSRFLVDPLPVLVSP